METKDHLRREYLERRAAIAPDARAREIADVGRLFFEHIPLRTGMVVSGYWPVRNEMDVRPILRQLSAAGYVTVLPCVEDETADGKPLVFHPWVEGKTPLAIGAMSIPEPLPSENGGILPDVLLVPLLAFDRRGHRLGYGKGMYDGTLHALRAVRPVIAVGVAFAVQECDDLPDRPGDERLDWILTGRGALRLERT